MPMFLSLGHAFRGGIDINIGVELEPGELYGPVLRDVYMLENYDADYARILIGSGMLDLISRKAMNGVNKTDPLLAVPYANAMACNQYIGKDIDGRKIVDYASQRILQDMPTEQSAFIEDAINMAHEQLCTAIADNDSHKENKIRRLVNYLESRKS